MKSPTKPAMRNINLGWWILFVIAVGITVAIRIRFLEIPLERDEGEYAYAGQLILEGLPPYQLAYNMKFPGTYAAYALLMSVFGQTTAGVHLGLLTVNAVSVALVYFLGRRLLSVRAGIAAAAVFAILSLSPSVLGLAGHATHFVILPVLGGLLVLLYPSERQSKSILFASGTLFGLGFMMKQPGIVFILFGGAYLLYRNWRARLPRKLGLIQIAVFAVGSIVPLAITCLILWWRGVFDAFWLWTIRYAQEYGTIGTLADVPESFGRNFPEAIRGIWPLWILAGVGLAACLWSRKLRAMGPFLIGFFVFSALAVCPGFYFRAHYFILVLPALSLLVGAIVLSVTDLGRNHSRTGQLAALLLFAAVLAFPLWRNRQFFFFLSPKEACRTLYGLDPFPESLPIANYLRQHTAPNDTLAVLGSEPQIYFYAHRHSASGYIYMYPLLELQKYSRQMQHEMIREIESARPKYLVFVSENRSWILRKQSENLILRWIDDYCARNYTPSGFVNIVSPDQTDYYFENIPTGVRPSPHYVLLYRRNS
jgi:4-amino-4-deoxy-L-arabinose transferase-like glycosyltransferase